MHSTTITRRTLTRSLALGAAWLSAPRPARAAALSGADPVRLRAIRDRMQRFVDDGLVAGAVTMVGLRGQVIHHEAVGFQDMAARRPMRTDAIFRIASMTKPITALAIMMLAEEGKLSVDDPIDRHLPEFRGLRVVKSRGGDEVTLAKVARPPTIRDLLRHTSGIPSMPPPGLQELYATRNRTLAEAVIAYSQQPLEFEPGSKWSYCNAGIDTAGRVVEVVSGQRFERFLEQRIFRPLGMAETACHAPPGKADRLATLYKQKDGRLEALTSWLGGDRGGVFPLPAGGAFSTARDLGRLYQALLDGGKHRGGRLCRAETLAEMTRVQTGELKAGFGPGMAFGLGFGVVVEPKEAAAMLSPGSYGHGGAFGTQGWIDPQKQMYFILLIQRDGTPGGDQSEPRKELQRLAVEAAASAPG